MTYYDDIGDTYPWAVKLPGLNSISLDFLGVPGSAQGSATAATIAKLGFPKHLRLGAGVIDGRSVWSDDGAAGPLVAALLHMVCQEHLLTTHPLSFQPVRMQEPSVWCYH